jgi:hypothetical protein
MADRLLKMSNFKAALDVQVRQNAVNRSLKVAEIKAWADKQKSSLEVFRQ